MIPLTMERDQRAPPVDLHSRTGERGADQASLSSPTPPTSRIQCSLQCGRGQRLDAGRTQQAVPNVDTLQAGLGNAAVARASRRETAQPALSTAIDSLGMPAWETVTPSDESLTSETPSLFTTASPTVAPDLGEPAVVEPSDAESSEEGTKHSNRLHAILRFKLHGVDR